MNRNRVTADSDESSSERNSQRLLSSQEDSKVNRDTESCDECGGRVVQSDNEIEYVCEECGCVIDRNPISRLPDWITTEDEPSRESPSGNNLVHDTSIRTNISWKDKDASGRELSAAKRRQMARLRRLNSQEQSKTTRNERAGITEIRRMGASLGIDKSTQETASVIFSRCMDKDLIRGRSLESTASAAIYIACRLHGIPRTMKDIATVSRVPKADIWNNYYVAADELSLDITPPDPTNHLVRITSDLGVSNETEQIARQIVERTIAENTHIGRKPTAIVGAAVYITSYITEDDTTQQEIADACDCCVMTIRENMRACCGAISVEDLTGYTI